MERESEESMVYDDEVFLSYFHILELLSSRYYSDQKHLAQHLIDDFTDNILANVYLLEGNKLQEERNSKRKIIESFFVSEIPVRSKIMFMFQRLGILNERLKNYISTLVKDRNSVAHGRQVYQERVIFPVPPFFPLIRSYDYSPEMIRVLSARAISLFLEIDHLKQAWDELDKELLPTLDEVKSFIKKKKYETLSIDEFHSGKEDDITPHVISYYLLTKKIKVEDAIDTLTNILLGYRAREEELIQLIIPIILILDKTESNLKTKCIEILNIASDNNWNTLFKMRDLLYYIEYLGHTAKTFSEMITNKELR